MIDTCLPPCPERFQEKEAPADLLVPDRGEALATLYRPIPVEVSLLRA